MIVGFQSVTSGQVYNSTRHITRGADTAEIYISCEWYEDPSGIIWNGIFHSIDNGKTLTLKRKTKYFEEAGCLYGDSLPGCIFQAPMGPSQDTFGISFDYGMTFEKKYFNDIFPVAAGCVSGEIYISSWNGLSLGTNFGTNFSWQSCFDSLNLHEVGTLPGEVYWYKYPYSSGPLGLAYSNDYGQSFTVSFLDFPGIPIYDECMIYRGTEPGEIYFVIWKSPLEIYLYHTTDYGQTLAFQSQLSPSIGVDLFTAGRTPGSFYHIQREICGSPPTVNSCLYVHFSRDYGVTFTEYYHNLDSTYTVIPPPAKSINFFRCFPNPSSDKLTVIFTEQMSGEVEIQFITLTGDRRSSFSLPAGQTKTTIDVSNLVPGLYLLKISSGDFLAGMKKVAIIH